MTKDWFRDCKRTDSQVPVERGQEEKEISRTLKKARNRSLRKKTKMGKGKAPAEDWGKVRFVMAITVPR